MAGSFRRNSIPLHSIPVSSLIHCLRDTGTFPPCVPAIGILHNSGKATWSFLPVLLLRESPRAESASGRSHDSGAQGFLKALLGEVGLLPLFIGTGRFLFPAPSSSPGAGPARSQATRVGGHVCCSLSLSPPSTTSPFPQPLCVTRVLRGSVVQSVLGRAKSSCLFLGGQCGLGRPPLSSGQGLIPPGGGTSRALGPSRHPASTGLPAGGTLLIPGLQSQLWKRLAPNASLIPPLPASARQTPPASIGRWHQGLPAGQT